MFRRGRPANAMPRRHAAFHALAPVMAVLGALLFAGTSAPAQAAATSVETRLAEQVVMVPVHSANVSIELQTTIYRPPGDGPFPVLVMNHGKARGSPRQQERDRFVAVSREFVKRGYAVVIPMRTGFAQSGGQYFDDGCNLEANGQTQANDVQGVVDYLGRQPWADKTRMLIGGQSHGGLTTMAYGTRNVPGVRGLINFAGGLRTDSGPCQWKSALVAAFAEYGAKSRIPSLWFYGANDSYFNPALAASLRDAFVNAGGLAKLVAFGAFKLDAHAMSGSRDGVRIWWPETERFLKQIGMPTDEVVALVAEPRLPKTAYAAIDNVDAIPYLQPHGREQYKVFLSKPSPRAFAVSSSGGWSWAEDGDDPVERVLATCQRSSGQACKVYAIDDDVVWSDPVERTVAPTVYANQSTASR